jgi:hypothetical protein
MLTLMLTGVLLCILLFTGNMNQSMKYLMLHSDCFFCIIVLVPLLEVFFLCLTGQSVCICFYFFEMRLSVTQYHCILLVFQVKVMKAVLPPNSAVPYRPAPPKPEKQAPPAPAPVVDAPAFSPNPESSTIQDPEGTI